MKDQPKYGINKFGLFSPVDFQHSLTGAGPDNYNYMLRHLTNVDTGKEVYKCFLATGVFYDSRELLDKLSKDLENRGSTWVVDEWYHVNPRDMYGSKQYISGIHGLWIAFKRFGIEDI